MNPENKLLLLLKLLVAPVLRQTGILFLLATFDQHLLNMYETQASYGGFELGYALSIEVIDYPNFPIDGIGLQPDYFFNGSIKNSEWIDFINQILNSKSSKAILRAT